MLPEGSISSQNVLDFGCGEGIFFSGILERSPAYAIGIDSDELLLKEAGKNLAKYPDVNLVFGGVESFSNVQDSSLSLVTALSVSAYFTQSEDDMFYREVYRVLKPGGCLLVCHSNILFDFFTFNKFTVSTVSDYLMKGKGAESLLSLLRHPDEPSRKTGFPTRENPLSFKYKASKYGFREARQEFTHFHPLPPLLQEESGSSNIPDISDIDTLGMKEEDRWKLLFQCSIFFTLLYKNK
jgi:ubiquinone/menaquinone biosynthesis C-methylase UbiE